MLDVCIKIFDELIKQEVNYCHWKSNEHLSDGLNGKTDMDLLVSKADAKKFSDILIKCECINVQPQFGSRYTDVEEWVGYDRETGKLIHLHVHYRMITGAKHVKEYILPWHALALDTKVLNGNIYVMEPNLELIILYMRIVLKEQESIRKMDRFVVPSEYRKEILWLKKQIDRKILFNLIEKIWKKEKDNVLQLYCKEKLTKNDWAKLQELARVQADIVRREKILNLYSISASRKRLVGVKRSLKKSFEIVPFTTLKTLRGKGYVFVFIGCDGSGKSSVTEEIHKWLSWKLDCQKFYFGTGVGYKKPIISRISSMAWLPDIVRKICRMMFYYQVSWRCVYMRLLLDFYIRRGGIAVCDRYPQTQFKGIYDGPKIQALQLCNDSAWGRVFMRREEKNIAKVENKKIDVLFKLMIPAEVALKRSPGHMLREVKRKAQITEKLQFSECDVYEIDATQPFEEEILEIKGIIWDKLVGKHS
ncbi:MAG: hypothetical protein HDR28_01080 [Lachnospiraceae bacterium]|nr:hypothetical protein [Lachnospiraceae bacterium]